MIALLVLTISSGVYQSVERCESCMSSIATRNMVIDCQFAE